MKMAVPKLSKETVLPLLLEHCEKIVVGIVSLVALWLTWSGISFIRTKSASGDLLPTAISSQAASALQHVDATDQPPADMLVASRGLDDEIVVWSSSADQEPRRPILARTLFPEAAKRSQPDVFPVERLQAVAGVAVLAVAADRQPPVAAPQRPARPFDPPPGGPGNQEPSDPARNVPPGKIVPYVIVTGLIPHEKQIEEFSRRFQEAGFSDPALDAPNWSDFLVERNDVTKGPGEAWQRLDLKAMFTGTKTDWNGEQPNALPNEYFLSPAEQSATGDVPYAWPMPRLAMEPWGSEAIHPWALTDWAVPRRTDEPYQVKFKVFRFVDTTVTTGHAYRYRVRVSLKNPNYRVPPQHLAEADLANAAKLPSAPSNETPSVRIPGTTGVLARLPPVEPKKGTTEVLVLQPNDQTGNYALHSVTTVPGGLIAVPRKGDDEPVADDRRPGRPGKGKGDALEAGIPVGMLLDFVGQQAAQAAGGPRPTAGRRGRKATPPAEPFEVMLLDVGGALERASVVDSEKRYRLYERTLPAELRSQAETVAAPESPFPGFK